ncbi:MAG: hypothetical protein NTZ16_08040 [Verrucomicrobia bacterium]|nr:hypothetical protein [Verrucomicrobiota bacterium]
MKTENRNSFQLSQFLLSAFALLISAFRFVPADFSFLLSKFQLLFGFHQWPHLL